MLKNNKLNKILIIYSLLFLILWANTLIFTPDLNNWIIENTLTILALVFLIKTKNKWTFSISSYTLIFVFLCLHVYGSKYTYAENPLGYYLQELFNWKRNHYDRMVHFGFGFLLAYPLNEFLFNHLKIDQRLNYLLPIEIILSISGLYEIIEWAVADIFFPEQGVAYLGTQGDPWDAQKDMFLAFFGAFLIMLFLAGFRKISKK